MRPRQVETEELADFWEDDQADSEALTGFVEDDQSDSGELAVFSGRRPISHCR